MGEARPSRGRPLSRRELIARLSTAGTSLAAGSLDALTCSQAEAARLPGGGVEAGVARRLEEERRVGLGNRAVSLLFSRETGALLSLYHVVTQDEYLKEAQERPASPFLLYYGMPQPYSLQVQPVPAADICQHLLGANDCRLLDARFTRLQAGLRLTLRQQVVDTPLQVRLEVSLRDQEGISDWRLTLNNVGSEPVALLVSFPYFGGIRLGAAAGGNIGMERKEGWRTIPAWNAPSGGLYGMAAMVSMPWEAVYDPQSGSALGLLVMDKTVCAKQIWRAQQSVRVFYFPERTILPGMSLHLPPARLLMYRGDWKPTASAFREWFRTAFSAVRIPGWMTEIDQYGADWMPQPDIVAQAKAAPGSVPCWIMTDFAQLPRWYQSPVGPDEKPRCDVIEWAMYNDLLLPSAKPYLINDAPSGKLYGSPQPLIHPTMENPEPYRGQQHADGTYRIRADLGGPEALRQGMERVHAQGRRGLFYVEGILVRKESALTADGRAQRWAIHQKPHEFYAPYGEHYWHMCPGCREWQEHLAAVCARLLRETGADGIRLDSHGFHWTPCYNPAHEHKHPFQWNEGLRQLLRMVHAAMTSVNPNAILETESLVDFFHESCAAALSQSAPGSDVSPVRVALPTYRVFDYAGNALDAFLYGSTQFRSTVPGIDLRLRTAELHHTFASALVSGALITPEPQASQPGWDCRLWRGDGYCLLTAAHLAGFQGSYPALDPAPVSALVVTLPSEAREIGLAYRVDAQTLEVAASPSAATGTGRTVVLDRPCCAVFLPFPHGPSLLTATATTPLRAGESTTLRLALAGRPTGAEPVRVVVSAPGLRVNGQPMTEAVLPAMVKITVPEDTEPGIYFLTARGRGVLPIKRFLEVTP